MADLAHHIRRNIIGFAFSANHHSDARLFDVLQMRKRFDGLFEFLFRDPVGGGDCVMHVITGRIIMRRRGDQVKFGTGNARVLDERNVGVWRFVLDVACGRNGLAPGSDADIRPRWRERRREAPRLFKADIRRQCFPRLAQCDAFDLKRNI